MSEFGLGYDWIVARDKIFGKIKQLRVISSEMKSDESVRTEISEIFDFYNEIAFRKDVPKTMISLVNDFYNTIIQTVSFLSDCKDLGWIQ